MDIISARSLLFMLTRLLFPVFISLTVKRAYFAIVADLIDRTSSSLNPVARQTLNASEFSCFIQTKISRNNSGFM